MIKVLNLYSGLGGNRQLWKNCEVTAVEINPEIADIYHSIFPNDEIVVGDAHEYLQEHYKEFDFIWSSPPCQTHSQIRFNLGVLNRNTKAVYADMRLYQEILFLQNYFDKDWVVENTKSYYDPLIKPQVVGNHFFWANFHISPFDLRNRGHRNGTVETLQIRKRIDISGWNIINKRQLLRNCVEPELGEHLFKNAFNLRQSTLFNANK